MQSGYAPFFFSSAVLLDGKTVVVEGGEYNNGQSVWTTIGSQGTVTPFGGVTWVVNSPPTGWSTIGDAQSRSSGRWNLLPVELLHQADRLSHCRKHLDRWSQRPGSP